MRTKKDIGGSFIRHLVSKFCSKLKVEVLEECFSELGEAVRVNFLLLHDDWKCDLRERGHWEWVDFFLRLLSIRLWLVLASTEEECRDHVPHQVLRSQLNDVKILIAKVLLVCEQGSEHSIGALCSEAEHERPVE